MSAQATLAWVAEVGAGLGCALGPAFSGSSLPVRAGAELEKWACLMTILCKSVLARISRTPTPTLTPAGSVRPALQGQGLETWKEIGPSLVLTQGEPEITKS